MKVLVTGGAGFNNHVTVIGFLNTYNSEMIAKAAAPNRQIKDL